MSRNVWAAVHPLQFQRGEGPIRVKKKTPKSPLRFVHILTAIAATSLLFFGITRLAGFLLAWDKLNVQTAEVVCSDLHVRSLVLPLAKKSATGNILLLNAAGIKAEIEACSWVKEAHVRKVFPSSLAIDVVPRTPAAIFESGEAYLLDRDNVLIERIDPEDRDRLPVFRDTGMFAENRKAKLAQGWICLDELEAEIRARVSSLDLSDPEDIVLTFRDDPVRLRLGLNPYAGKIAGYLSRRNQWTEDFGPLEYVDLRFPDRIYLKVISQEAR